MPNAPFTVCERAVDPSLTLTAETSVLPPAFAAMKRREPSPVTTPEPP